jgi:hypothetical protein
LVWTSFVGKIPENKMILLKDKNAPPSLDNLRMATQEVKRKSHTVEIRRLHDAGLHDKEIAAQLGITQSAVCHSLKRNR